MPIDSAQLLRTARRLVLIGPILLAACSDGAGPGPAPDDGVASVEVTASAQSLLVGHSLALGATPLDAEGRPVSGRTVTWTSSSAATATVSAAGVVTAVAPGTVTITAAVGETRGSVDLAVSDVAVASVSLALSQESLHVAWEATATVTAKDAAGNTLAGRPVTLASSDPAVAVVEGTAVVGVAPGRATIVATVEGKSAEAAVTVSLAPVATVALRAVGTADYVVVGETLQLSAILTDARGNPLTGRVVTWSSSAPGMATVSGTGLVSGAAFGATNVTATVEGKSAVMRVDVGERTTADRDDDHAGHQLRYVYVIPSDVSPLDIDLDGRMDSSAASTNGWLRRARGRTLRVDTYQGRLDVAFLRLDLTEAELYALGGTQFVSTVWDRMVAAGLSREQRVYVAFYDGRLAGNAVGQAFRGTSLETGTAVPRLAVVSLIQAYQPDVEVGAATLSPLEAGVAHEVFHTFGAVDPAAPNAGNGAHVADDGLDLMASAIGDPSDGLRLDAGNDDYYGHGRADVVDVSPSPYWTTGVAAAPSVRALRETARSAAGFGTVAH
jgi:uncharacterized protein YjdB